MKKVIFLSVFSLALLGAQSLCAASSDSHTVNIVVPSTYNLVVADESVTLDTSNSYEDATTYDLSTNNPSPIKIVVGITAIGTPAGITLDTSVAAPGTGTSAGTKTLIAAGTVSSVNQDAVTGIVAGTYTDAAISYSASLGAGAVAGNQAFTVTYTAMP